MAALKQPTLEELDLSNNLLRAIPHATRAALDSLAANHTFSLRLRGNPLACTCAALDSVLWLALTPVRLDGDNVNHGYDDDYDDNGRDYPCALDDDTLTTTAVVAAQWIAHWRRCHGLAWLTAASVAILCQLLGLLLMFVLYSKWTYLRYFYRVLRRLHLPTRRHFTHDILLLHAEDDLDLARKVEGRLRKVKPELRVATVESVRLGTFLPDSIAGLIDDSWKVVLLMTQNFLRDDVIGNALLYVQCSINDVMPDRVIVLYWKTLRAEVDVRRPALVSMERLMKIVSENSVYDVTTKAMRQQRHMLWRSVAERIVKD